MKHFSWFYSYHIHTNGDRLQLQTDRSMAANVHPTAPLTNTKHSFIHIHTLQDHNDSDWDGAGIETPTLWFLADPL